MPAFFEGATWKIYKNNLKKRPSAHNDFSLASSTLIIKFKSSNREICLQSFLKILKKKVKGTCITKSSEIRYKMPSKSFTLIL